jgi:hypothetical protein
MITQNQTSSTPWKKTSANKGSHRGVGPATLLFLFPVLALKRVFLFSPLPSRYQRFESNPVKIQTNSTLKALGSVRQTNSTALEKKK